MGEDKFRVNLTVDDKLKDSPTAERLSEKFHTDPSSDLVLKLDSRGLSLVCDGLELRGDFTSMLRRLKGGISRELLARAAKIKGNDGPLTAVDATAGLGEDSLILAAAGFNVDMYEYNPIIFELLRDALERASRTEEFGEIIGRMRVFNEDSTRALPKLEKSPDVVFLDPMFPQRQKSALVKKKLQMIQKLEMPCLEEKELLLAAMEAGPKKLIVKRPPKGPFLADIRPDHSITGKAVRFDCFVSPRDRIEKYK